MKLINIKKEELFPAIILFISFFSIIFSSITGSALKESVFLTYYDKSTLPLMYVFTALLMTFFVLLYNKLSILKDQISVMLIMNSIFIIFFIFFTFGLSSYKIPIFYILFEIFMGISVMQFWVIAGEVFNSRQAKRIFTIIISGGSFASILAGYFIQPFSFLYGVESLLYISILLVIFSSLLITLIRPFRLQDQNMESNLSRKYNMSILKVDPYIKNIAVLVALSSFISKIIDYQFKITATNFYTTDYELVSFFGNYYALTGLTTLIFQLFLSSYLLKNFGVLTVLILLPSTILIGSSSFLLFKNLSAVFFTKFSDQVIKFSTNSTMKEILWLPVSKFKKQKFKPIIDGSLKSFFEGFSGLIIFMLIYFDLISEKDITFFSYIILSVILFWVYNCFQLKKGYIESLLSSIESRQLNLDEIKIDIDDEKTIETIDNALNSKDELKQLYTIDLLWDIPLKHWKHTIRKLFNDGSIKVSRAILELTWNNKSIIKNRFIINKINEDNILSEIAIHCAHDRKIENLRSILSEILSNKDRKTYFCAAIVLLVIDSENKNARKAFRNMKKSTDSKVLRVMLMNIKNYPNLLTKDELIDMYYGNGIYIRNIILEIIKEKPDEIFFEIIFESILNPKLKENALKSLHRIPRDISQEKLKAILINKKSNRQIIVEILKFGNKIIDRTFINQLIFFLNHDDSLILSEASNAIVSIAKKVGIENNVHRKIEGIIEQISKKALILYYLKLNLMKKNNTILLVHEIENEIEIFIICLIKLGTIRNSKVPLEKYIRYVKTKNKLFLPVILELIDTTFSNTSKSILLPLLDADLNLEKKNKKNYDIDKVGEESILKGWIENNIYWKKVITIDYLLRNEKTLILKTINWDKVNSEFIHQNYLRNDQNYYLKNNFLININSLKKDKNMYSIIEKTLILKSIDLFTEIPGDLLAKIGQISKEIHRPEGFQLFLEGDHGDSMYVIAKGRINIKKDGKEITSLENGMSIGEMALLDQEPRSADAFCSSECILLEINEFAFYELMASSNEIMKQIVKILSKRIRKMNTKLTANLK